MISLFAAAVLSSSFLLSPPGTCIWAFGELESSSGDVVRLSEECGVSDVKVLSTSVFQVATADLSDEENEAYRNLRRRLEEHFVEATPHEQNDFVGEILDFMKVNHRSVDQTWIAMGSMMVHYLMIVDSSTDNVLIKLEDETTGQYIGILARPASTQKKIPEMLRLRSKSDLSEDEKEKLTEEIDEAGRAWTFRVEVNGVVLYIDGRDASSQNELQGAFDLMWQHLPEGDGKRRIEMAIPVIWKAMVDEGVFFRVRVKWPTHPEMTPFDPCLTRGAVFSNTQTGGGLISLELPPAEILEEFFGKPELPLPDPDWTFEKLRRKLL